MIQAERKTVSEGKRREIEKIAVCSKNGESINIALAGEKKTFLQEIKILSLHLLLILTRSRYVFSRLFVENAEIRKHARGHPCSCG